MSVKTWRFNALDMLFFKEARPMGSLGDSELQSVFPPPPRTVMGAIRSAIGEYNKVNWADYINKAPNEDLSLKLIEEMGDSRGYGNMALKGLFLSLKKENEDWQRLYPVPANLVATQEENKLKALHFLTVGQPLHCDLGKNIRMPVAPELGIKTLGNYWLTETGLNKVLLGQIPDITDLFKADDLYSNESRLGIARDNLTRGVQKGLLYQTQHIRSHRYLSEKKLI
jgi:CRISPR-associated protein Cmr3